MAANDTQIAGTHYRTDSGGEQHWDRQWRLYGRGYFVGCATKYIERYHLKNGVEDLKKARHFLDKLIELEEKTERSLALRGQGYESDDKFAATFEAEIGASRRREGAA